MTTNPFMLTKPNHIFCEMMDYYMHQNPNTRFVFLFNKTEFNTKIKFKVIRDILANLFISPSVKTILFDMFCKTQRFYFVLSRFANDWKYRKAKVRIDTDLYLNPIQRNHKHTITVYDKQTRSLFLFTCTDLMNIIMTSLTHCIYFCPEPLMWKNPYTNLQFNLATMYNIYFHMKENYMYMHPLLHSFFACEFNLELFLMNHEQDIRNIAAKNYLKNSSVPTLYMDVMCMLYLINSRLFIHARFPQELLVNIMRPYLYLYTMFIYSINGSQQRSMYYVILNKKLGEFIEFNPHFGRKIVSNNRVLSFNMDCPPFTIANINTIIKNRTYLAWSYSCTVPSQYNTHLSRASMYTAGQTVGYTAGQSYTAGQTVGQNTGIAGQSYTGSQEVSYEDDDNNEQPYNNNTVEEEESESESETETEYNCDDSDDDYE